MYLLAISDEASVAITLHICTLIGTGIVAYFAFRTSTETARLNVQAAEAAVRANDVADKVEKVAKNADVAQQIASVSVEKLDVIHKQLNSGLTAIMRELADAKRGKANATGDPGDIRDAETAEARSSAREKEQG